MKVDRVEWIAMPDAQTAVNALQSGDIDFLENVPFDLVKRLAANSDLKIETLDKLGFQTIGRMNFLYPPFDNVKVRRAAFLALNQKDVLDALVGNPGILSGLRRCLRLRHAACHRLGSESLVKGNGMAEAKKLLAESGYDGTPVVIMAPGDALAFKAQPIVAAQLLREAGFKVDLQATDWQTVVSRRASRKPPKEGGWNMLFTNFVIADVVDPVVNILLNAKGTNGAWFGWPEDARMEAMRDAFVRSASRRRAKEDRRRHPARSLRPGDLCSARTMARSSRVAQIALGRARRPGHAGVLEHRQVGVRWVARGLHEYSPRFRSSFRGAPPGASPE